MRDFNHHVRVHDNDDDVYFHEMFVHDPNVGIVITNCDLRRDYDCDCDCGCGFDHDCGCDRDRDRDCGCGCGCDCDELKKKKIISLIITIKQKT